MQPLGLEFQNNASGDLASIAYAKKTLRAMHDPVYGPVGEELMSRLEDGGCRITNAIPDYTQTNASTMGASYACFDDEDPRAIFINQINIFNASNPFRLTISIGHEATHADTWQKSPILHASPYNNGNPIKPNIILCPEDAVRLELASEEVAFAVQKWVVSMAGMQNEEFYKFENNSLIMPQSFEAVRWETGSLKEALTYVGIQSMHAQMSFQSYSFGQHYALHALEQYRDCHRLTKYPEIFIPVRLTEEDLMQVGETIGPNIMGDPRLASQQDPKRFLIPESRALLDDLNAHLKIGDKNDLPTFREALDYHYGLNPEQFLEASKTPIKQPEMRVLRFD